MFSVDRVPTYLAETCAGAARLQEQTTPEQYSALVERAEWILEGLITVETHVDQEIQVKIALREKFDRERVKEAVLLVATWQLFNQLAQSWAVKRSPAPARAIALTPVRR